MLRKFLFCGTSAVAIICASNAYAATFSFGFTGEVESGTIETSGTYELRLRGADGGAATGGFSFDGARGGFGALLLGQIDLLAGDLFRVLVGGDGASTYEGGGGGGLSYFSSGANLAIAGGGGGASGSSYFNSADRGSNAYAAYDGFLGGSGGSDTESFYVYNSPYGTYYESFRNGGGGAGWRSDGQGGYGGETGPSWTGGSRTGGFGGGGGAFFESAYYVGGGGAGSFGGISGETDSFVTFSAYGYVYATPGVTNGGGGGGSYFSANFQDTASVVGQARFGGAYLTLDLLSAPPAPVPLPASAALLGSTIAGMGFAARRRRKKS